MYNVVVVAQKDSLDDVVKEIGHCNPNGNIFKARNHGEAMGYILHQKPSVILVDKSADCEFSIYSLVKENPHLSDTHIIYFVDDPNDVKTNSGVNQWYVKGDYDASVVVATISDLI